MLMISNNIKLLYLLTVCKNTWFWLGVWVFYYLKFTDYAGIGLVETVLIVTMTVMEVPTGVIGDILGKKKTLLMGMAFETLGSLWMTFAGSFVDLLGSVFVMVVGGALISGTFEALLFDSLKQIGKSDRYVKIISKVSSIKLITIALSGLMGGFMYTINHRLPFMLNTIGYGVGFVICLFLVEPKIDTDTFIFKSYLHQTRKGFVQLFRNSTITRQTIILLSIAMVLVIMDEMLNSFLALEYGFNEKMIGLFWSGVYILSAVASNYSSQIIKLMGEKKSIYIFGTTIAAMLIMSPIMGLVLGGISLLIQMSSATIMGNLTSDILNNQTESAFRATTLSTFNLIKNIPYLLLAYGIGAMSDVYSARVIAMCLGIILVLLLIIQWFFSMSSKNLPKIL